MHESCTVLICFLFTKEPNNVHFSLPVFSLSIDYTGASFGSIWEHSSKEKSGRCSQQPLASRTGPQPLHGNGAPGTQASSVRDVCISFAIVFSFTLTWYSLLEKSRGKFLVFKAAHVLPTRVPVTQKRTLFSVVAGEAGRSMWRRHSLFTAQTHTHVLYDGPLSFATSVWTCLFVSQRFQGSCPRSHLYRFKPS